MQSSLCAVTSRMPEMRKPAAVAGRRWLSVPLVLHKGLNGGRKHFAGAAKAAVAVACDPLKQKDRWCPPARVMVMGAE